jgi:hypothetical protein
MPIGFGHCALRKVTATAGGKTALAVNGIGSDREQRLDGCVLAFVANAELVGNPSVTTGAACFEAVGGIGPRPCTRPED